MGDDGREDKAGAEAALDGGAEGDQPARDESEAEPHDATGLDLARSIAKAAAAASMNAPRRTKKHRSRRPERSGGRPKASGAFPDERDPQTLDTTLGRLVSDHGWAMDLKVHGVFGRWDRIVGEEVANHCRPVTFADDKLVVRADSTAWATQLRLLAPTLVRRLNEELGHGSVTLIEVEGPNNLPSWRKGRLRIRDGRGPRDTYG